MASYAMLIVDILGKTIVLLYNTNALYLSTAQIANTLRLTSIIYRSDAKTSGRCLIDVNLLLSAIWKAKCMYLPNSCVEP